MTREQDEESYLAICRRAPLQRSNGAHGAAARSAYVTMFACLHLESAHAPLQGGGRQDGGALMQGLVAPTSRTHESSIDHVQVAHWGGKSLALNFSAKP